MRLAGLHPCRSPFDAACGPAPGEHWTPALAVRILSRHGRCMRSGEMIVSEKKMTFLGIGVHVLVALFFAVHAMRSGQPMYWIFVLFSFPLLGSIVYFLAIYLPNSRLEHGARKVVAAAARTLDPTRELREAKAAFDYTPTAQNQMRLALAQLEAGAAEEAANNYEACLQGPFANDKEIRFCAARAFVESGRFASAITHLKEIRASDANFRAEQVCVLLGRALAGAGQGAAAKAEFEAAGARYSSFAVQAEYAIWALTAGESTTAERLLGELEDTMKRWNKHTRELNQPLIRRINAARAIGQEQTPVKAK